MQDPSFLIKRPFARIDEDEPKMRLNSCEIINIEQN